MEIRKIQGGDHVLYRRDGSIARYGTYNECYARSVALRALEEPPVSEKLIMAEEERVAEDIDWASDELGFNW